MAAAGSGQSGKRTRRGVRNKTKQELIEILQKNYPGYEAVLEMAKLAHHLTDLAKQKGASVDLLKDASAAHDRVAKYTTPQIKAISQTNRKLR